MCTAGSVRADDNAPSASNHRFVGGLGHPSAGETGLIYMKARYMGPAAGRFISEDPAGNGANWFVYCNDDPVNEVDANGRISAFVVQLVLGAVNLFLQALGEKPIDIHPKWADDLLKAVAGIQAAVAGIGGLVEIGKGGGKIEEAMGNLGGALTVASAAVLLACLPGFGTVITTHYVALFVADVEAGGGSAEN